MDLKSDSGRADARHALGRADVYLENLGPGVVERLGLAYADVRACTPDIIYCSVSGYGRSGPYARRRAYDTVIQGESGIMSLTGRPDMPTKIGVSAGGFAGSDVRLRRYSRRPALSLPATARVSTWTRPCSMSAHGRHRRCGRRRSARSGSSTTASLEDPLAAGVYPAADGQVSIGVETDVQRRNLVRLVGLDHKLERQPDSERIEGRSSITRAIGAWTRARPVDVVVALCQSVGVPAGRVCSIPEVMTHRRTAEREMLVRTQDAEGLPLVLTGSPFKLSRTPGHVLGRGPLLDEREPALDRPAVALAAMESPIIRPATRVDASADNAQARHRVA